MTTNGGHTVDSVADVDTSSRALTVLLTSVAYFMVTLDALVVVTALPSIHRDLGGGIGTLQWTVTAYNIAFGAGVLTAAALGDRLGRRRVYVVGLAVFTMASAACALAPNAHTLVAFRAVQGVGAATVLPLGLTLLTSAFPPESRGTVVGIWGGIAGLAVAAGPLIGGAITQGLSWHWIFWVNVPIGALAVVGARLRLAESLGPRTRLDIPAVLLISGGVGFLIWGLVQGSQNGWASAQCLIGLTLGVLLIGGFIGREGTAAEPMVPLAMFRKPSFSSAVGTQFLMASSIFSAAFLISQYFQFARGYSPLATGLRFLPWTATPLVVAPVAGALSDRAGARVLALPGLLMQAIGFAWIVHVTGHPSSYTSFVIPFVIAGVGISMALPSVTASALNAVEPALLGKAAGTLNTMQQFGAVFGIAIVTAVFNSNAKLSTSTSIVSGFRPALGTAAGLSLLGAIAALGIASTPRASAAELEDRAPAHPTVVPATIDVE
jgi:EmrB/QacA subfamily drug resistance transporter